MTIIFYMTDTECLTSRVLLIRYLLVVEGAVVSIAVSVVTAVQTATSTCETYGQRDGRFKHLGSNYMNNRLKTSR